jgi:hypothetical protein
MNREVKTAGRRNGKGIKGARPVFVIYDEIDSFVDAHPNMRFKGWDVEVLRFDPMGWAKVNGVQVDRVWHTKTTVCPDESGRWAFDPKDTYVAPR